MVRSGMRQAFRDFGTLFNIPESLDGFRYTSQAATTPTSLYDYKLNPAYDFVGYRAILLRPSLYPGKNND